MPSAPTLTPPVSVRGGSSIYERVFPSVGSALIKVTLAGGTIVKAMIFLTFGLATFRAVFASDEKGISDHFLRFINISSATLLAAT